MTGKPEKAPPRKKAYVLGIQIFVSVFIILNITILSRYPSLAHSTRFIPFWSYTQAFSGLRAPSGILLNVALFIPFGWFLAAFFQIKRKKLLVFLLPILLSITIESIQYYTGRGIADIDDVISNSLGGVIGIIGFIGLERLFCGGRKRLIISLISVGMIIAGCIGVYTTYNSPRMEARLREYSFVIKDALWAERMITINGSCVVYGGETPQYQIILTDGKEKMLVTKIDGEQFTATGETEINKKYEVLIRFSGHETMSTGIYVNSDGVEFVAGDLPVVDGVPDGAVLKAYDKKTDTLVYQDGNRLLWLIGSDIDSATEIIYHIHTDEPEKLPENRKRYGFDNRGFKMGTGKELEPIEQYRVFEAAVPSEYHVAEVIVGFNTCGKLIWEQNFRIEVR